MAFDIEHLLDSYNVAHAKYVVGMEIEYGFGDAVVGRYTDGEESTFIIKWRKITGGVFGVVRTGDDAGAEVLLQMSACLRPDIVIFEQNRSG